MTVRERLACMGFPSYDVLAVAMGVTRTQLQINEVRHALGNAMHVGCVGVFQTVVLACVKLNRD